MYTGWDSCATYTNACLLCPVGVGDKHACIQEKDMQKLRKYIFQYKSNGGSAMAEIPF